MNYFTNIVALFFLVGFIFSLEADAGQDYNGFTQHNGNMDANLTTFQLNGSNSSGAIVSYQWSQTFGEPVEIISLTENWDDCGLDGVCPSEENHIPDFGELNGVWDEGEFFYDENDNNIYDNGSIAYFNYGVAYNSEDEIFEFMLTVTNQNNYIDTDVIQVIVKPELNEAPQITLKGLTNTEDMSVDCGGSTQGGEDGIECPLFFLNDTFIDSITDPEGDSIVFDWYNDQGLIQSDSNGEVPIYNIVFIGPDPHYLYVRAIDAYNAVSEVVLTVNSVIVNSYPVIDLASSLEIDEEVSYTLSANIEDQEHLLSELDIQWSCSDGSVLLDNLVLNQSLGTASIDFLSPSVQYNSESIEFSITIIALDPYQQLNDLAPVSSSVISVTVNNINKPPQVTGFSEIILNEDENSLIDIEDLSIQDEDNFNSDFSLVFFNGPNYDLIGNFIKPTTESNTDVEILINVVVSDGEPEDNFSDLFQLPVTVNPVNDLPVILNTNGNIFTQEDVPLVVSVSDFNVLDPDSDLFYILFVDNSGGTNYTIDNGFIYPDLDFFGVLDIPVRISDQEDLSSLSDVFNMSIDVTPINDSPVSAYGDQSFDLFLNEDFEDYMLIDYNAVFSDVDDDNLEFNYIFLDSFNFLTSDLNNQGELFLYSEDNLNSLNQNTGLLDKITIEVFAKDSGNFEARNSFDLTVLPINDAPIFYSGVDSLGMTYVGSNEQTSIIVDLNSPLPESGDEIYTSAYVEDIEGDSWRYEIVENPFNGVVERINDTSFRYYPNPGFRCRDKILVKAIDVGLDYLEDGSYNEVSRESGTGTVEIIVDFCNLAPFVSNPQSFYNQQEVTDIQLIEDEPFNISDVNLDFFYFEDSNIAENFTDLNNSGFWEDGEPIEDDNGNGVWDDSDEVVSMHAINWNDFGEDGIELTGDFGENDGQWNEGEGWSDCGTDGLCPKDEGYIQPDIDGTEYNGQWNEGEAKLNTLYTVEFNCLGAESFTNQDDCEYYGGFWETVLHFKENYNGELRVAIQANDGKEAHNLSDPYIVSFNVYGVNDPPIIKDAFLSDIDGEPIVIDGSSLNYIYEDNSDIRFNITFEDIDSDIGLNSNPFSTNDLYWQFLKPPLSDEQKFYASYSEGIFSIDSLKEDWNGKDSIYIKVQDLDNALGEYYFVLEARPVNDIPYGFNASFVSDTSLFEDIPSEIQYKVSYLDVDADPDLNRFNGYNFVPDDLGWQTDYLGSNFDFRLLDFTGDSSLDYNNNFGELGYNRNISYDTLRENWNGYDSIPLYVSSNEVEANLDTVYLNIEVLPLNDAAQDFDIYGDLKPYAMDETTFYIPCTLVECEEGEQIIHGLPFGDDDNFFRLHNELLIQASVDYDDYDAGKLLFKWNRTTDIDLDGSVSQYFQPGLYYRLELGVSDPQNTRYFVLSEVNDSFFDNENYCNESLDGNQLCSNDDFSFMTDSQYAWAVVDMRDSFFNYEEGFYSNPDLSSGQNGFYTASDSSLVQYNYNTIDYLGTTEYKWRVVAYNKWWDYKSVEVPQNKEVISDLDAMRFFIDLERPYSTFSIVQNPLYHDLYELYMVANEGVNTEATKLFINGPSYEIDVLGTSSDAFYYAGQFEGAGSYEFELWALDLLENGGISNYSLTYGTAGPENFSSIVAPNEVAELVIPRYSVSGNTGFIISSEPFKYEGLNQVSVSDKVEIISSNLSIKSPLKIKFKYPEQYNDNDNLSIGKKNQFGGWDLIESNLNPDFIEADIVELGRYSLFRYDFSQFAIPEKFDLIGCYPNPFNPNVTINFSVPFETHVKLDVYDLTGKKVKTLIDGNVDAGYIDVGWNGLNDFGSEISSGIYLVVLNMNNKRFINKITMLK